MIICDYYFRVHLRGEKKSSAVFSVNAFYHAGTVKLLWRLKTFSRNVLGIQKVSRRGRLSDSICRYFGLELRFQRFAHVGIICRWNRQYSVDAFEKFLAVRKKRFNIVIFELLIFEVVEVL